MFVSAVGNELRLRREGRIAAECWLDISRHFFGVAWEMWVVMPDHIHGIILLGGSDRKAHGTARGSVSAIIQNHKSVSSRRINRVRGVTSRSVWQRNYYEHVIRGDEDLARICRYIDENPSHWELDEENQQRTA